MELDNKLKGLPSLVLLQAMGDNLISLNMLDQINEKFLILGTKHTYDIALLMESKLHERIHVLYDEIPSFYDIRNSNILNVVRDVIKFRKFIKDNNVKKLVFEKSDFRVRLLTFGIDVSVLAPTDVKKIYGARKNLYSEYFREELTLLSCVSNYDDVKKILLSPTTRVSAKNITRTNLLDMISVLHANGFFVQLIDYDASFSDLENIVDDYYTNTSLYDVRNLIKNCDMFIGADSFLVHLAHYYRKQFFIVFNVLNTSFLPPGCVDIKNYIVTPDASDFKAELIDRFISIGLIESSRENSCVNRRKCSWVNSYP
ncbi:hypothetical protein [Vibrio sp. 2-2(8)]|uniref:hypothetical protein n=1 Tax=Vibrio sp. 2-2(8) TaxID=2591014 RepID=UPI0014835AC4|nr:hypothetical protein [Vibrio sp. 2-2(8)]NNN48620.1 hypothetical protein [Vibrio sp. 2-2(8)]